ncbi:MAG: UvrB/UvrC motif-containing protein [Verrucomicrobiales bacterium]|jgi:protein arginine kinase activator|nr:UvrB/UvrC motif-containing protein [Verrucomicrobiales bacterium]
MTCEKCQSATATVFLTEIANDEMRKLNLCVNCARVMGVSTTGFNLTDLLLKGAALAAAENAPPVCPVCGFTEADLRKTGLFGCPQCYETFAALVDEAVRDTQRAAQHTGKIPRRQAACRRTLERELAAAVSKENYELAAQLRDRLKNLRD